MIDLFSNVRKTIYDLLAYKSGIWVCDFGLYIIKHTGCLFCLKIVNWLMIFSIVTNILYWPKKKKKFTYSFRDHFWLFISTLNFHIASDVIKSCYLFTNSRGRQSFMSIFQYNYVIFRYFHFITTYFILLFTTVFCYNFFAWQLLSVCKSQMG